MPDRHLLDTGHRVEAFVIIIIRLISRLIMLFKIWKTSGSVYTYIYPLTVHRKLAIKQVLSNLLTYNSGNDDIHKAKKCHCNAR